MKARELKMTWDDSVRVQRFKILMTDDDGVRTLERDIHGIVNAEKRMDYLKIEYPHSDITYRSYSAKIKLISPLDLY